MKDKPFPVFKETKRNRDFGITNPVMMAKLCVLIRFQDELMIIGLIIW